MDNTQYEPKKERKEAAQAARERRSAINRVLLWGIALVVIGGVIWSAATAVRNTPSEGSALLTDSVSESDWVKGNPDAGVVLVEYSDFQCPACGSYFPIVKQLVEEFGDDIAFVYRHFPLSQIHSLAEMAARAAEAAGRQGAFWEMHDLIFQGRHIWSSQNRQQASQSFTQMASALGLNAAQLAVDMESPELRAKVQNDYQSGIRSSVRGTPTFFLNGERIANPRSYEAFAAVIQAARDANVQQ